ncbi:hypothetical protein Tco_0239712, partial [Tanacetum coccineum]
QSYVAMSSAEAEYVAAVGCYAQVLWIKSQLADYDVLYDKVPIFYDNTNAIAISNNPVLHSRTKHIDNRLVAELGNLNVTRKLKWQTFLIFNFGYSQKGYGGFLTAIGLTDSKFVVPLPPKGTVRAGLANLGLADKDKPSLTSTELVNSSPLKF